MGCLAYTESLTSADVSSSYKVSEEYSPKGFEKPKGVKFYEDPYQDATSRLNIGLYQFTPNSSGNIYPCVLQWNDFFPENKIDTRADQNELIRVFGSSFQSMNAFCGINKVVQTFAIQVNTDEQKRTHPGNRDGQSLKASSNRCVTPWFYASYAYNHFGPLQNSTGNNLKKYTKNKLKTANNIEQIKSLYSALNKRKISYPDIDAYIPSIEPINPYKKKKITSKYGNRFHPIDGKTKKHLGIDISAPYGTPIHSTARGIVSTAKTSNKGYGNQLLIVHGFGFSTRYAHLSRLHVVKGQIVNKGDVIGFVGSSGKSTGAHLHYELKKNKKHKDPYPYCFLNLSSL